MVYNYSGMFIMFVKTLSRSWQMKNKKYWIIYARLKRKHPKWCNVQIGITTYKMMTSQKVK